MKFLIPFFELVSKDCFLMNYRCLFSFMIDVENLDLHRFISIFLKYVDISSFLIVTGTR